MRLEPSVNVSLTKTELNTFIFMCQDHINRYKSQLETTPKTDINIIKSLEHGISKYTDLLRRLECSKVKLSEDDKQIQSIDIHTDINSNINDPKYKEVNANLLKKDKFLISNMPYIVLINCNNNVKRVSVCITDIFDNLIRYVRDGRLTYSGQVILVLYEVLGEFKIVHPKAYMITKCDTDTPQIKYIGDAIIDNCLEQVYDAYERFNE